jgi:hypothetical protein
VPLPHSTEQALQLPHAVVLQSTGHNSLSLQMRVSARLAVVLPAQATPPNSAAVAMKRVRD